MMYARSLLERARAFLEAGVLDHADVYSVALVAPRYGEHDPERLLGLAFAARAPRIGHVGVDLTLLAEHIDAERAEREAARTDSTRRALALEGPLAHERFLADDSSADDSPTLPWPEDAAAWAEATLGSSLVGAPQEPHTPFVRQPLGARTLLLTRRMYREQERLVAGIHARLGRTLPAVPGLATTLAALFPEATDDEARRAVEIAARRPLALIVGGPGTGKTYSVSRLLAALLASTGGSDSGRLQVALAAPTGKAAARMQEALREAMQTSSDATTDVFATTREAILALPAETLHRLIGIRPDGTCRHHATNPLPADLVVVDEVSMVDLQLMRQLVEALRPEARLVLLGDRDQLASVEAGSVLADLIEAAARSPLAEHVQTFTVSRRFASAPDIGLVAACLQSYETKQPDVLERTRTEDDRLALAVSVLCGETRASGERDARTGAGAGVEAPGEGGGAYHPTRRVEHLGAPSRPERGSARPTPSQLEQLVAPYLRGFFALAPAPPAKGRPENDLFHPGYAGILARYRANGSWKEELREPEVQRAVLDAFDGYRVLAVHRAGPLGVAGLERELAAAVRAHLGARGEGGRHWVGRPILITRNAYDVGLMNGDVGIVLPTRDGNAAVFPAAEGQGVRAVATARLPPHDGALVMTVHKSQGSQFDRVALVLAGRVSTIQTRELVYTGVTRARNQLAWLGEADELRVALSRRVDRISGLAALLA